MIRKIIKRMKCEHEYHQVGSFRNWGGSEYLDYIVIYCPKCDKQKSVYMSEFRIIERKRIVRESYRKRVESGKE